MTIEKHKRATELLSLIPAVKEDICRWEQAIGWKGSLSGLDFNPNSGRSYATSKYLPFDVAKTLSLAGLKKELTELQNEFDSL